ncbi:MAG: hypothetical protein ABI415_11705 [Flavitalea sp.]
MAKEVVKKSGSPKKTSTPANAGAGKGDSLLQNYFLGGMEDIDYAEKVIARALPKMKRAATCDELKHAFNNIL